MERYTVVWAADVQNEFIDDWINGDSGRRQLLNDVANTIDRELAIAPENHGEPLPSEPALRVWTITDFVAKVSVAFEVRPDNRIVRVLRISIATS